MSLLLPDLERHLRDAVRAEIAATAPVGTTAPSRAARRRPRLTLGTVFAAAAVLVAVVIGAIALSGIHHRGATGHTATGPPASDGSSRDFAVGNCEQGGRARAHELLHGRIAGDPWVLRGLRQPAATHSGILRGSFVLNGRSYPICPQFSQFNLIDLGPHGIVYGYVAIRDLWAPGLRSAASRRRSCAGSTAAPSSSRPSRSRPARTDH